MPHETTTVRVSRRTHQLLSELAAREGRSVSELLDQLAERARREQLLKQYAARMAELSRDPSEQADLEADRAWLGAAAGVTLTDDPPYPQP
jgi:predicted CopG family antitoxin